MIQTHIEDSIGYLTLDRPDKYNSINKPLALEIQKTLHDWKYDQKVRAIYITGSGKAFCAGQDLGEIMDPEGPKLDTIVKYHYNPIVRLLREIEKPIVAAVNGVAAGAGANIALACDVVIAKESASFIQAFSKIGLIPDSGGTFTLPRLIGFQRASALMMLGDKVSARDAEQMGMIYQCVADDDFEAFAQSIAKKLASMPTKGLGLTKRALNASFSNDLNTQLKYEDTLQIAAGETYDYNEGVTAFIEKRTPEFKGE